MRLPELDSTATMLHKSNDRRFLSIQVDEIAKSADHMILCSLEAIAPEWIRPDAPVRLRQAVREGLHIWSASVVQVIEEGARVWLELLEHELQERRQSPRVVLHTAVEFQRISGPDPIVEVRSADISETGIRLLVDNADLVAGERLMLTLFLASGVATTAAEIVGVHGDIVRIRFLAMHHESQRRIRAEVAAGLIAQHCDLAIDQEQALTDFRDMLDSERMTTSP